LNQELSWREGERIAADHLREKGWNILELNFRNRSGEIDILAAKGKTLACVEVKTWQEELVNDLERAVNWKKIRTYASLCRYYLYQNPEYSGFRVRFDLIWVDPEEGRVDHIQDAFMESA